MPNEIFHSSNVDTSGANYYFINDQPTKKFVSASSQKLVGGKKKQKSRRKTRKNKTRSK